MINNINPQIPEALWNTSRIIRKKIKLRHITVKLMRNKDKRILKIARGGMKTEQRKIRLIIFKVVTIILRADLWTRTIEARG